LNNRTLSHPSKDHDDERVAVSPSLLRARTSIAAATKKLAAFTIGDYEVTAAGADDAIWLLVRRPGQGGLALRAAPLFDGDEVKSLAPHGRDLAHIRIAGPLGRTEIRVKAGVNVPVQLQMTCEFTPAAPTLFPQAPRDLLPLDRNDDPLGACGHVEAVQRGLNTAILYFQVDDPAFGNILYFQNLTSLADYFDATGTKPEGVVGGVWPELGLQLPSPASEEIREIEPLAAGKPLTLSDAILVLRPDFPQNERDSARQFLQMLGAAYRLLDLPPTEYRDWVGRAEKTLRDLDEAPEATIRHYGHRYIHPYTDAEYPDAMVQLTVAQAIHEWGKWDGEPHPLEAEFLAGVGKFYDRDLETIRRYLPNVGDDKDADAVDSWYLYHPLLNLGRLALDGDAKARRLFLNSLDYAIKAARHFGYKWPIQYKVTDFSMIEETAGADGRGQTDVGGVYAWVMLQAFELTDEKRFLDEARLAIDAAIGLRFDINYQANLTAWGAAACMRLWRATNREVYREQSYVYLASFFHHCEIWESRIDHARHYSNFLGATCLQDAPYMAIYECFDSFAAFEHYLADSGPDLEPAARMLIAEYCKYTLDRAWYYYPDALPPEAIADKQRENNGHIDRALSFPLENLYPDGQPAGQVGQEIYGAGAALVFATRAFHHVEGAPFLLFCNHFIRASERTGERTMTIMLDGGETCSAGLSFVRRKRRKLTPIRVASADGDVIRPHSENADRLDYNVPASGTLTIGWD
jgi:hypothetical protein